MKSYIKLYGPPVLKAIEALEKMSINMPKVCIMDPFLMVQPDVMYRDEGHGRLDRIVPGGVYDYFKGYGEITKERCNTIISKKGDQLGEYDFFFEWMKKPSMEELRKLIAKIDEELEPLGIRYSIVTK